MARPSALSWGGGGGEQTWLKGVVILSSMWCLLVRVGEPGDPQASLFWHTPSVHRSEVWSGLAVRASGVEVPGVWFEGPCWGTTGRGLGLGGLGLGLGF